MSINNLERFKDDLKELSQKAVQLQIGFLKDTNQYHLVSDKKEAKKIKAINFVRNYEIWYTEAYRVIKQIIPERLNDFAQLYKNPKRKLIDYSTYTISDAIIGIKTTRGSEVLVDSFAAFPKFQQQVDILQSAVRRFESSLFDIRQILQYDLFDSELDAAKELNKKGFLRGAGAISGVVLERHLQQVCESHKVLVKKTNPSISDLNDLLKKEEIIEVPDWRFIQHLSDIRNLCDHKKNREPKKEEIEDLINGVSKVIKSIF